MDALPKKFQTREVESKVIPGVSFVIKPLTKSQKVYISSLHTTSEGHTIIAMAGLEAIRFSLLKIDGLNIPETDEPFMLEFEATRLGGRKSQVVTMDCIDQIPDELFNEIGKAVSESAQLSKKDREKLDPTLP